MKKNLTLNPDFARTIASFHFWTAEILSVILKLPRPVTAESFFAQNQTQLPPEVAKWFTMPFNEFGTFLVDKLGTCLHMMHSEDGKKVLLGKMIDGVAEKDPSMTEFLLYVKEDQNDVDAFFQYLHILTGLAEQSD